MRAKMQAMPATCFDTLHFAEGLKAAGTPAAQADATARLLSDAFEHCTREFVSHARLDAALAGFEATMKGEFASIRLEMHEMEHRLEARMDAGFEKFEGRFAILDGRFSKIDNRFSKIDDRFSKVDDRFSKIDDRFSKIDDRFAQIDTRLFTIERSQAGLAYDMKWIRWLTTALLTMVGTVLLRTVL